MDSENENDKQKENNRETMNASRIPRLLVAIFITATISICLVGGGVYLWQEKKLKELEDTLNTEINYLENELAIASTQEAQTNLTLVDKDRQISELNQGLVQAATEVAYMEKLMCKGAWVDGECILNTCIDSDASEDPEDIYIAGSVTTTNHQGVATTRYDTCTGSKRQVNELWCYESPQGSGNFVMGRLVHDCPYGCDQGACVKGQ